MSFRVEKRVSIEEEALTAKILGAAVTVHRILGPGFVEAVYHRALERELPKCGLLHESEKKVDIWYDGVVVGDHRLDLVVESRVVVELKAVSQLSPAHYAQVRSYLRALRLRVGLLLNFADSILRVRRIINDQLADAQDVRSFRPTE